MCSQVKSIKSSDTNFLNFGYSLNLKTRYCFIDFLNNISLKNNCQKLSSLFIQLMVIGECNRDLLVKH